MYTNMIVPELTLIQYDSGNETGKSSCRALLWYQSMHKNLLHSNSVYETVAKEEALADKVNCSLGERCTSLSWLSSTPTLPASSVRIKQLDMRTVYYHPAQRVVRDSTSSKHVV